MGRFLLRRVVLALPTLLGITLITFGMIHLAPGAPVMGNTGEGVQPLRRQELVATRRLFFLDLPLFYNPSPRGVEARVGELLRTMDVAQLRACGTLCLPELVDATPRREVLGRVLAQIRADSPRLGSRREASAFSWARQVLPLLEPRALLRLAAEGRLEELERRGTAALPATMEVLLHGRGALQRQASYAASALARVEGRLDAGADREQVLALWSEWWFQHRRDYVRFTASERVLGRVTETQFAKWLSRVLTCRFGNSIRDGRPVVEKLGEALPVTLLLSLISMALAYLVAVPLGIHAAVRRGTILERALTTTLFICYSLPPFWVAMVLILAFGGVGHLDWFPIYGLSTPGLEQAAGWTWFSDRVHHLVLPVVCLSLGSLAVISRYQRSALLDVIRQDYIRTARAKGLSERAVIFKHALRNSLLPIITLMGLQFPFLISGSVIIERIFNIPGMGLMTFEAFLNRDYPVIMAVSVIAAAMTLVGLVLADLLYAIVDPRIAWERRR